MLQEEITWRPLLPECCETGCKQQTTNVW